MLTYFSAPSTVISFSQNGTLGLPQSVCLRVWNLLLKTPFDSCCHQYSSHLRKLGFKNIFSLPRRLTLFMIFTVRSKGEITGIAGESGSVKVRSVLWSQKMYLPDSGSIWLGNTNTDNIPLTAGAKWWVCHRADLLEGSLLDNIVLGDTTPDNGPGLLGRWDWSLSYRRCPRILTPARRTRSAVVRRSTSADCFGRAAWKPSGLSLTTTFPWIASEEAVLKHANGAIKEWASSLLDIACTLSIAQYIYVLNDGRITEKGSHTELIQQNGQYAAWCRQQGL